MDPVSLVAGALVVGAVRGVGESAATAVKDAYGELRRLVLERLHRNGDEDAARAVERAVAHPESPSPDLPDVLTGAGVASDAAIVEAARRVMELLDPAGAAGAAVTDARNAQGVQIGNHNIQSNVFGRRIDD